MGLGAHWPRIENTTFVIVRAVSMGPNLRYEELEKSSELWIGRTQHGLEATVFGSLSTWSIYAVHFSNFSCRVYALNQLIHAAAQDFEFHDSVLAAIPPSQTYPALHLHGLIPQDPPPCHKLIPLWSLNLRRCIFL